MKSLKQTIIENLEGFSFEEIVLLLNEHHDYYFRGALMDAMQKYFPEKYYNWLERH